MESIINNTKFESIGINWLKLNKVNLKESTYQVYLDIINNHLIPYFKNTKITKITENKINEYICDKSKNGNKKSNTGLNNKTINLHLIILNQLLNSKNCKIKINYLKVKNTKIEIVDKNIIQKIIYICSESAKPFQLGILIAIYTGIRIGELCALKWENIDLENGVITIEKTLERIKVQNDEKKTKIVINNAKTQDSIRKIPIPMDLLNILKNNQSEKNEFVLTKSQKPMEPRNLTKRFKNLLINNNINVFKFHLLRHTFATTFLIINNDPKVLQEILGHADVRTTLKLYVHPNIKIKKQYMLKFGYI